MTPTELNDFHQRLRHRTALLDAVAPADAVAVRRALRAGANPEAADPAGRSALMMAALAATGPSDVVIRLLIQAGARVDRQDLSGNTALLLATHANRFDAVHALLQAGADPNIANQVGHTPLMQATNGLTVRRLVAAGAALDTQDRDGMSALMHAARWENVEAVQELLNSGADATLVNGRGHPAEDFCLQPAEGSGSSRVMEMLRAWRERQELRAEVAGETIMGTDGVLHSPEPIGAPAPLRRM